jgi:hypothetical protein
MTPANINIEETAIGVQYAISCTERLIKPQRHVYRGDGSDHFETWVRP